MRTARTLLLCYLVTLLPAGCRCGGSGPGLRQRPEPRPLAKPVRAVWVARFHYRTPDDIQTILKNCAALGCNTVLWQVRGEGTVAYPSRIEPWSAEYDFNDPGFDPLAIAVVEAHRHGLRIEAWVNVMPGWRGPDPPPIPNQLYHARPDWFLYDAAGRRQPLTAPGRKADERFYVILNPCLPEVRRHIGRVMEEIASNYDVDGLHLDYVRYAWDTTPDARQLYPRDARTLAIYRQQTGKLPEDDPQAWGHWRANQLTLLVGEIRKMLGRRRPGATLTAAVWADPSVGYREYFQNAIGWLRTGLLDAAMPMAYTEKLTDFEQRIGAYQTLAPHARIVAGLGIYRHDTPEEMGQQLERCRLWGGDFALFSYESLHATAGDRKAKPAELAEANRLREMRRGVLARFADAMK